MKKIILVEYNELVDDLMFDFIKKGYLPNFSKLYESSQVYTTNAGVGGYDLNPWIQWVTVHTGLNLEDHNVKRLNEASQCDGEYIWDKLSALGDKSWICGSMNASISNGFKGEFLPDPWSNESRPYPENKFSDYFDFVSHAVQEHSVKKLKSPFKFVKFLMTNGLKFRTVFKIIKQLINEKLKSNVSWKRASLLDWIQYDLFANNCKKKEFKFSTFFLNSTAHYQHHYWKDMQPELFDKIETDVTKKDAILYGYKNMDSILGDILKNADEETQVIFCTALSQKPFLSNEFIDGKVYYRMHNKDLLESVFGLKNTFEYSPLMAEQFQLNFNNEADADAALLQLNKFLVSSTRNEGGSKIPVLYVRKERGTKLVCQCNISWDFDNKEEIFVDEKPIAPFLNIFYKMDDVKSGIHSPIGMFWVMDKLKKHSVSNEHITLESISPFMLDYMKSSEFDYELLSKTK